MTLLIVLAIFAIQPLAFIVVLTVSTVLDLCDRVFKAPVPVPQHHQNQMTL